MYRRSQKDLKDNLDNIPSIPQEVRDLFGTTVALYYVRVRVCSTVITVPIRHSR